MSIEGILLETFSAQTDRNSNTIQPQTSHAVFNSFLSDDKKQYAATTISHRKHIITLLKQWNIMSAMLIKI